MNHDWLDKHIEEQAKHYGLSVQEHAELMKDAAEYDELITSGKVDEPCSQHL